MVMEVDKVADEVADVEVDKVADIEISNEDFTHLILTIGDTFGHDVRASNIEVVLGRQGGLGNLTSAGGDGHGGSGR